MLYIEYEQFKTKFYNAQQDFDKILSEKEELFAKTQPQSTKYDKEPVKGGSPSNSFDEYLIAKEKKQIEERLTEARTILNDRKDLLLSKEEELRQSKNEYDIIYKHYFIDCLTIRQIERRIPSSKSEIDRKLQKIKEKLQLGTKGDKSYSKIVNVKKC